jgi:integrase
MNEHPGKNDLEAPMWFKLGKKDKLEVNSLQPMQYDTIRMRLKKLAKKAGIKKRIHRHLFRHSRATYMADYLTEAQMNVYFGWIQGSEMPSVYVHLSGRDIDDAILKANGIVQNGASKPYVQKESESPKRTRKSKNGYILNNRSQSRQTC